MVALEVTIFWLLFSDAPTLPLLTATNHDRGPGSIPTSNPRSGVLYVNPVTDRITDSSSHSLRP